MYRTVSEPVVAVAIDAQHAVVVHLHDDEVRIERLESEIPVHHASTGHVRERFGERHGGTGPHAAGDGHRLEHERRFVLQVVAALPDHELLVIGPGPLPGKLARAVGEADRHRVRGGARHIEVRAMPIPTDGRLVAMARAFAGAPPRRRLVGLAAG